MPKSALEKLAAAKVPAFERREHRPNVAFEITKAELVDEQNRKLDWNIFGALTEVPLELTITGASVVKLVCEDPYFSLLNDPIFSKWMFKKNEVSKSSARTFSKRRITDSNHTARYGEETEEEWTLPQRPIDLNLDGIWFRLSGFSVSESKLTLVFEDRVAAILRSEVGSLITVNRGSFTRAMFIEKLAKLAERNHRAYGKIPLFIPEAKIHQRIAAPTAAEKASDLKSGAARALGPTDGVTVKGQPANPAQLQIMNEALEVAVELRAPFKAQAALIAALIDENDVSNPNPGNPNDRGPLSLIDSTVASLGINPYSVASVCGQFLTGGYAGNGGAINLAHSAPHLSIGEIAHAVQGNLESGEATYQKYAAEAEHAVKVYGASESGEGESTSTVTGPYAFTRGPNETSWDCIQRLASEVSWYAFVRENTLWYVSGDFLFAQEPQLHVERGKHGIDWVNPNIEIGARDRLAEVEVHGRARPWTAVPGNMATVARVGPANGRWVVDSVTLDILDRSDALTAKLIKPLPARPEPAATGTVETPTGETTSGASPKTALAAFNASSSLSEMQLPYLWGGGHSPGALDSVAKGGPGLDCSGSTCWVLKQAGMFTSSAAQTSGELETWGAAGQGKEMTVWASASHVFIEYTIPGHGRAQMNTNGPQNGPRLYTLSTNPTYNVNPAAEGYTARHWPGT